MIVAADSPGLHNRPVYDGYFADPFAFRAEGVWWAVGTGSSDADGVCPMLMSEDFVNWRPMGHALIPTPSLGTDYWAPEIIRIGDRYRMFYSVGRGDNGHQLRVAESVRPEGPYRDLGEPVLDPASCYFAIDAHVYTDPEGANWLFYARDFLDGQRPGTALVVAPLLDGRRVEDDFHVVARANADWQLYEADRPMYEGRYDWHTLEGPSVVRHENELYCLYSGGNWTNETYGVDYVTADRPDGDWRADVVAAPRILKTQPGRLRGPGHNSVVQGPDSAMYIVYHAWNEARTARKMHVTPLVWTEQGPRAEL
ncbi:glycoside hydrolase [bacterium]|nr:MAG: glycoside hydrolase [bacterium]